MRPKKVDLAIVGGGPAGLAVAINARLAGLTASVFDSGLPPLDQACGEGLMPDACSRLLELGIDLDRYPGRDFRGVRYIDDSNLAEGRFPGPPGRGVRRTVLHEALVERASDLGVELRWGETVTALSDRGIEVGKDFCEARWIIGADGRRSKVRRWAELDDSPAPLQRFGVRRHFALEPWTDLVEVHWGSRCEAYVTPVADCLVGVAFLWSGEKATFPTLMKRFPALEEKLNGAAPTTRARGAGPLEIRARRVIRDNVALVGDASGFVDAIAGEGLALAFHQARELVDALSADLPHRYASHHRRLLRGPRTMTRLLLKLDRLPVLRARVIAALAADSAAFDRLLALHARELTIGQVGLPFFLRFAARLVAA